MDKNKWCDFNCEFAEFLKEEHFTGACNRELAIYCSRLERPVSKNIRCLINTEETDFKE